jgi:membrane-bound metal-dependent hydrolase YbcI (DUF457 family)
LWPAAITGAFVGIYSHVRLDAVMHAEMERFWPLATANPLLGLMSMPCTSSAPRAGLSASRRSPRYRPPRRTMPNPC